MITGVVNIRKYLLKHGGSIVVHGGQARVNKLVFEHIFVIPESVKHYHGIPQTLVMTREHVEHGSGETVLESLHGDNSSGRSRLK